MPLPAMFFCVIEIIIPTMPACINPCAYYGIMTYLLGRYLRGISVYQLTSYLCT